MKLTIGIKALNEEKHIAEAIESALAAARVHDGEVILADSGSTDRTLEIARGYPIRIVQLTNSEERCCGAGAQLAYQFARGDYFYILDGDMVLDPAFMAQGLAFLESHPGHAAVGGRVREMNVANAEFRIRAAETEERGHWLAGDVDRLDCGGLYRVAAIREAGYFADRNLHAFEEFELAARLACRGWKLARIDVPAVRHYGHVMEGMPLLLRRIRSGYTGATGEVLRAAIGRKHLGVVLRQLGHIRKGAIVIGWWALLIGMAIAGAPLWAVLPLAIAPFLWFWWRRRDVSLIPYSFAVWNSTALGLVSGFFRPRVAPTMPLAAREVQR